MEATHRQYEVGGEGHQIDQADLGPHQIEGLQRHDPEAEIHLEQESVATTAM